MEKTNKVKENLKKAYDATDNFLDKTSNSFIDFVKKYDILIFMIIISLLGIVMRILIFPCVRGDYTNFLTPWYENIYNLGFAALGRQFGDYTPAYNYFLWFISLFGYEPGGVSFEIQLFGEPFVIDSVLFSIKAISCMFDFGIAIFVYFIIKKISLSKLKAAIGYALTIFGLTIFLNSALWGQCDSIYVFFIIGSIYFLLIKKQRLAFIFLGLSFCFKLQAIFALPAFIVLYFKKYVKLRYFLYIPLVYIIVALPAAFAAGSSFFDRLGQILSVYFNQTVNGYKEVTLNAGTFYALIFTNYKQEEFVSSFALFLALAINGTIMFLMMRDKKKFSENKLIKMFLIFSMTMPYFLPYMHERYFYLADVLVLIYVALNPKKFYVAILEMLNSMIGYMVYLWNVPFFNVVPQDNYTIPDNTKAMSLRVGSIFYLSAIAILLIDYFNNKEENEELSNNRIKRKITSK